MADDVPFREAERLFHAAFALPPEGRFAFVERECAGDESMRTWLLSLLSHAGSPTVGFTPPPPNGTDEGERMAWLDAARTCIGPYTLVRQLGEGGFGAVYLAEQTEPIRRTVALKIIKPGMDSKQVLARFERERQALALMNHPGIARVLDAGVTDPPECRPYFVMELVTGTPITAYCDQHELSLNQRLELFGDLCRALQHAHQKGVVHRDLKPSNILVTVVDGRAVPKVIDFGIAKALRSEAGGPGERTIFTEQGQLIGTPEYMSPEQADGFVGSDDIDTRSDIYSLGVILYELLTGVLPFDREQLHSAGFSEIQRIIREVDPPRPSTRWSATAKHPSVRASKESLVRALRSDLDWVVMRCLEKDRSRRYETADALAQDIIRFLQDEPVSAGPPSTTYWMQKFVRRNRTGVLAGASVFAALILATGVSISFALSETEQRRIAQEAKAAESELREFAEAERDRAVAAEELAETEAAEARRQAEIAEAVAEFLADDLLSALSPEGRMGRDVTMRAALDAASEKLDEQCAPGGRFADKPETESRIRHAIGVTYRLLGEYDTALHHFQREFDVLMEHVGLDDIRTLDAMNSMAVVYSAIGDEEMAEPLFLTALEGRRRVLGDDHWHTLVSIANVGQTLTRQGHYEEAEVLLREGLEGRRRVLGDDHGHTMHSIVSLAALLRETERLEEAEQLLREGLAIARESLGNDNSWTRSVVSSLAIVRDAQERFDEAEALYRETVELAERIHGDDHLHTFAAHLALGVFRYKRDAPAEAVEYLQSSADGYLRVLGEGNPLTLNAMGNLALALQRAGRPDEAAETRRKVLHGARSAYGDMHASTITEHYRLGALLLEQGALDEAIDALRHVLEIRRRMNGNDHNDTAISMFKLAEALTDLDTQESLAEAELLLRECLVIRRSILPEDDWRIANVQSLLGGALLAQGKLLIEFDTTAAIARFTEAESLLIDGYEQMNPPPAGAARKAEALRRIIDLYEAWHAADPDAGHDAKAEQWRVIDSVTRRPWQNGTDGAAYFRLNFQSTKA